MLNEIVQGLRSLVQGRPEGAGTGEKRELIRLKCRYKVTLSIEKQAFGGHVTDMGLKGMRAEVPERLKVGTPVHVTYSAETTGFQVDTVKTVVAWCRKSKTGKIEVGLRYDETRTNLERSWVKLILRELGFDEKSIFQRRKARRAVAMLPAQVARMGQRTQGARVLNLGVGGALLQSDERFDKGQDMVLDVGPALGLPVLSVPGEVVTCRYEPQSQSWLEGVRFRSMDQKQLDLLTRYIVNLLKGSSD